MKEQPVPAPSNEEHFQRLARLLELESAAEAQKILDDMDRVTAAEAERSGNSLGGLVIVDEDSGLGGRCLLTLAKRNRLLPLPRNRLEPGTPVLLSPEGGRKREGWRGVVCQRGDNQLSVALNEPPPEQDRQTTYRLDLSSDETARLRQHGRPGPHSHRRQGTPGPAPRHSAWQHAARLPCRGARPLDFFDSVLNASQQEAVRFALIRQGREPFCTARPAPAKPRRWSN